MFTILQVCPAINNANPQRPRDIPENYLSLKWSDYMLWYKGEQLQSSIKESYPDVFYLLPVCIMTGADKTGHQHFNADPTRADHKEAWKLSAELADTIFATHANLFLPYYRQPTFEGLKKKNAKKAGQIAVRDAIDAFDYYIKHFNNGRPFILAGFSYGGKMITEILKHMDDDTYSRLIAAYVIGYGITAKDTMKQRGHRISHIKLAQDSTSHGVTINFNSVTSIKAISPLLCHKNIGCINPISWTTTSKPSVLLSAGDSKGENDSRFPYGTVVKANIPNTAVTVSIDSLRHVLLVKGVNPRQYSYPPLQNFFPIGNLHLQELFFFGDYLRHNVLLRSGFINY